ncbi:MAG: hypothetical protein Q7U20_09815 [Caulobacter sp.]|nr:hypothetical protein [Caulobacter sp.]
MDFSIFYAINGEREKKVVSLDLPLTTSLADFRTAIEKAGVPKGYQFLTLVSEAQERSPIPLNDEQTKTLAAIAEAGDDSPDIQMQPAKAVEKSAAGAGDGKADPTSAPDGKAAGKAEPGKAPDTAATAAATPAAAAAAAAAAKTPAERQAAIDSAAKSLELEKKENELWSKLNDPRQKILDAVRSVPDVSVAVGETLKESALAKRDFAPTVEAVTGFRKSLGATVTDFFDLKKAERDDLLDRIGFLKGLVVDHGSGEILQQSFREVLRREPRTPTETEADKAVKTTTVAETLYRKPRYSGFFDNSFTLSEAVHQAQANGVRNLKFSLAVGGEGDGVKVGAGVGYGSSRQSQENTANAGRTLYVTTSYYLPKIELSFRTDRPVASVEFVSAVTEALKPGGSTPTPADWAERFQRLAAVLRDFGHFVPTRLMVGGRLYATNTKTLQGGEDARDIAEREAASARAYISAIVVSAQGSASKETGAREQASATTVHQHHQDQVQAMGGEGSVLRDPAVWATSLDDYRRWSVVLSENLIPTIDLLPTDLRIAARATLKTYAQDHKVNDLIQAGAHFLFYGDYAAYAGALARKTYFKLRNVGAERVLAPRAGQLADYGALSASPPAGVEDRKLWHMTAEGHVVSARRNNDAEFALTWEVPAPAAAAPPSPPPPPPPPGGTPAVPPPAPAGFKVMLMQRGRSPNQSWEFTGSGHLQTAGPKGPLVPSATADGDFVALPKASPPNLDQIWAIEECDLPPTPEPETASDPRAARDRPANPDSLFRVGDSVMLRLRNTGMVLTIERERLRGPETARAPVVLLPAFSGQEQVWIVKEGGRLESALGHAGDPLVLSPVEGRLMVERPESSQRQRWALSADGFLSSHNSSLVVTADRDGASGALQGSAALLLAERTGAAQAWDLVPTSARVLTVRQPAAGQSSMYGPFENRELLFAPVRVRGEIRGLRFGRHVPIVGSVKYYPQPYVQGPGGLEWAPAPEGWSNADLNDLDDWERLSRDTLYLPPGPIEQIQFRREKYEKERRVLIGWELKDGEGRLGQRLFDKDAVYPADRSDGMGGVALSGEGVFADRDEEVIGIGFGYLDSPGCIVPRLVVRKRG